MYIYDSPIGKLTLTCSEDALTGLHFGIVNPQGLPSCPNHPILESTIHWLDIYFTGKDPGYLPPLEMQGSPFRRLVGEIMLSIPFSKTTTYGHIAKEVERITGKRASAQAVGQAVGHNRVAIIVPCHRVIGKNGKLTGFAGGLDRKVKLLENEGVLVSKE